MCSTKIDAHGNVIYNTDPSGNEIGLGGKWFAGILLVGVTLFTIVVIVAHWPDKMPPINSKADTKYQYKWFAIKYLGEKGENTDAVTVSTPGNPFLGKNTKEDSIKAVQAIMDSLRSAIIADSPKTTSVEKKGSPDKKEEMTVAASKKSCKPKKIDLNTLLLLLVALSGFLGNMIHISSSFTNFIGAGKFKRSWMLWYWVKPFTAAALAVGVYIIFRAGFLNSADATASVNLYGVVAIAILAGLFTDMATQKLKEIFGVVFQSGTVRPNALEHPPLKITSTNPAPLPLDKEVDLVVSGFGFDNRTLKIKIDGNEIKGADVQANSIAFKYKATEKNLKPELVIYDEKGVEIIKYELLTKAATEEPATEEPGTEEPAITVSVTDITPTTLVVNAETEITITGTGLNGPLVIKVGENVIDDAGIAKTADSIKFKYTADAAGEINFVVLDEAGTELLTKKITAA